MHYIKTTKYNNKHSDFKGIFENFWDNPKEEHLKGKRTLMVGFDGATTLLIEDSSLKIVDDFEQDLITTNNTKLKYLYTDDWHRPVFNLNLPSGKTVQVVLLEDSSSGKSMFSYTDYGEPDCPLKEEYQVNILR